MGRRGRHVDSEDRPRLTPEDLETLRLAASMGYYESPRECRMEDIADELGISKSAVYHRMNKVEREAISWFLEQLGVDDPLHEQREDPVEQAKAFREVLKHMEEGELPFELNEMDRDAGD